MGGVGDIHSGEGAGTALGLWLVEAPECVATPLDCKLPQNRSPVPGIWQVLSKELNE